MANSRFQIAVLVILDGWGVGPAWGGNAITQAHAPTVNWLSKQPTAILQAAGPAVGLAAGEIGNSEVGHLNLGAGRIVTQESTAITAAIAAGRFEHNSQLFKLAAHLRGSGGRLHLVGLLSGATVHSNVVHLLAILDFCHRQRIRDIALHVIMDGRDSDPRDGLGQLLKLEPRLQAGPAGRIRTVMGRYFAMDRDQHWDRTAQAYQAIVHGRGPAAASPRLAISQSYSQNVTDEFLPPQVINPVGAPAYDGLRAGDAVLFWNFRPDRMRQLVQALARPAFRPFPRGSLPPNLLIATLTNYQAELPIPGVLTIVRPTPIANPLAEVISRAGAGQFHIAETEKYAHVTYFFNGGREEPFPREERLLVPSLKVATYDAAPAMQAAAITDAIAKHLEKHSDRLIVANYANADMVGHTGNFQAALRAVEAIDHELERLRAACRDAGAALVVTADHGNAEEMVNPLTGEPATEHTGNPVPCHVVASPPLPLQRTHGILADVAPTILAMVAIPQPTEMTGQSLLS